MSNVLVSVIIPAYNAEKTLEKCVESVMRQKCQEFEVIIVDDGSIDNTFTICELLKKRDKRISIIHQKNGGSSAARNAGINKAKGEYLVFIDGDDAVDELFLYKLLSPAIEKNLDIVMCGITVCYQQQNYSVKNGFEKREIITKCEEVSKLIYESCENGMIYSPCNKLYKRDIILDRELYFPLNKEPIEDILFNCEYLKHVQTIAVIPECLYYYNKNDIESNVTRYRKNIWDLSLKRSFAVQSLFQYWKLNSTKHMQWLALEYIGGKSDCISNCYRRGSNLHFFEKVTLFKTYIINDKKCYKAIESLKGCSLHYDKKLLKLIIKIQNAVIFTSIYDMVFFFRYKLKKVYYYFRKNSYKKGGK